MIKRLLQFSCLLFILCSCGDSDKYQIEGKIKNLPDDDFYAVFENDNNKEIDTITCKEPGQFLISKRGDFNEVTLFFSNKEQWITAYLEKGEKVSISGDLKDPFSIDIKGGEVNDQLRKQKKELEPFLKEKAVILQNLNKGKVTPNPDAAELATRLANINHQLLETAENIIRENPDQKASVVLIERFFLNADNTRKIDELLAILEPKVRDFYLINEIETFSNRAKRTEIGAEAPDFTVKNIYGETLSLDSFPDKYLLLAFTAPWTELRHTHMYLDEIQQNYKEKDLKILLMSLDTDLHKLRTLLAKDSIQWNIVTDSAGQSSSMIDLYNVNILPRCFIIDKNKEIILKTDNGLELTETLEELFNK